MDSKTLYEHIEKILQKELPDASVAYIEADDESNECIGINYGNRTWFLELKEG